MVAMLMEMGLNPDSVSFKNATRYVRHNGS